MQALELNEETPKMRKNIYSNIDLPARDSRENSLRLGASKPKKLLNASCRTPNNEGEEIVLASENSVKTFESTKTRITTEHSKT